MNTLALKVLIENMQLVRLIPVLREKLNSLTDVSVGWT